VFKQVSRKALLGSLRQVARFSVTRRIIHRVSVSTQGESLAFLRLRRLLPNSFAGRTHPDSVQRLSLTPSEFEKTLVACQKTLRFVHPGEALLALGDGKRLKSGSAILTIDESFASTAELGLPILRRLGIPVLFFVTTEPLTSGETLWDQEVHSILEQSAPHPLSLNWVDRILRTDGLSNRLAAARRLLGLMVTLDEIRLMRRLHELRDRLEAPLHIHSLDRMLNHRELAVLAKDPLVSMGAHGHRHFVMSAISDDALEEELGRPREILRDLCQHAFIDVVSYPFGRKPYFDDRVVQAAQAAGYKGAFTAEPGVARPGDHLFRLPRLPMTGSLTSADAYELQGLTDAVDELLLVLFGAESDGLATFEG
jgi:peptidoglycan/xylan/chitin deacetylase (PgdA/CDA1 family)